MNFKQKIVVVITDVLLIVEICISMYLATRHAPADLTPVFVKSFALLCVPTLITAKLILKRLRSPELAENKSHLAAASIDQ